MTPPPPGEDDEFDFAHLLESTRHIGVEDAAVRDIEDDHDPSIAPATPIPHRAPPAGFCEACGNPRQVIDRFCEHCGSRLPELEAGLNTPPTSATSPAPVDTPPPPAPPTALPTPPPATPPVLPTAPAPTPAASIAAETIAPPGVPGPPDVASRTDPGETRVFHEPPIATTDVPISTMAPPPVAPVVESATPGFISAVPGIGATEPTPAIETTPPPAKSIDPHAATTDVITPDAPIDLVPPIQPQPIAADVPAPGSLAAVAQPEPPVAEAPLLTPPAPAPPAPEPPAPGDLLEPGFLRPAVDNPVADVDAAPEEDEEGETISIAALRARREAEAAPPSGPTVQAVHCPEGHPNPPHFDQCRRCGTPITDHTVSVIARPPLGTLIFDDGRTEILDAPLVIGRKPLADQTIGDEPARAVKLDDPDKLLSRVHAEIRIADWQVQVIDRESMNHTFVQIPGQTMFQLRPGEAFPIPPGTRITFAELTSCHFTTEVVQP